MPARCGPGSKVEKKCSNEGVEIVVWMTLSIDEVQTARTGNPQGLKESTLWLWGFL